MSKAKITATMGLDPSKFKAGVASAGQSVDKFKSTKLKALAGAIGGAFAVGAMVRFANNAMNTADTIDNLSNKLDLSYESLQSLQVMSRESGIEFGKFEQAVLYVQKAQAQALSGNKQLANAFGTLGITSKDLRDLNTEKLFEKVAKAMADGADDAETFDAVLKVVGTRSGAELKQQLIALGKEGFDPLNKRHVETGQILRDDVIKPLNDTQLAIERTTASLKTKLADAFGSTVGGLVILGSTLKGVVVGGKSFSDAWDDAGNAMFNAKEPTRLLTATELALSRAAKEASSELQPIPIEMDKLKNSADPAADKIGKLNEKIADLNQKLKDAEATDVTFNIPEMTGHQLQIWQDFFTDFQGVADTDVGIDISLPTMTNRMVAIWRTFFGMLYGQHGATAISVQLPTMTNSRVRIWTDFFTMVSNLGVSSFEMIIPKMSQQQIRLYEQFFDLWNGVGNQELKIKLPQGMENGIPLDISTLPLESIKTSLEKISSAEGILAY
ncbi:MAG: hypothetical protein B6244_14330 [Candidatus Cloacimonetes bacterium 4572_55]|nr:MAG: hypothetical protein B6244_14330 [Candidatus Cloacimonetes bacterium 4572_55]